MNVKDMCPLLGMDLLINILGDANLVRVLQILANEDPKERHTENCSRMTCRNYSMCLDAVLVNDCIRLLSTNPRPSTYEV